ncbi:hypothetical protein PAENIP36_50270 [Paenibacillus sp. P36]
MTNICLVCGYDNLYEPPYDEHKVASDEICPCCGFHFGYDDDNKDETVYIEWRKRWMNDGCRWFSKGRKQPSG